MPEKDKYKVNPVEVVILMTLGLVFCNSVYNLFYENQGFHPAALKPMAANPISEGRQLASSAFSSFQNEETDCEANSVEKTTQANKIRLSGPLCGADTVTPASQLIKASVINDTNKFSATVFTDTNAAKFSTDYIPLSSGKNQIKMEFSFRGGKVINHDVSVSKF